MVGSPQILMCTVNTVHGVEFSSVIIEWTGPEGSYANNSRVIIEMDEIDIPMDGTPSLHNTYNSTLQFTYLMEGDAGIYTCGVMILETSNMQTVEIESIISKKLFVYFKVHNLRSYNYFVILPISVK